MLYTVQFYDKHDQLPVRQQYMQAHLDWLDENEDVVLIAGSLRVNPEAPPRGAMWIVEAPNQETVEALLKTDPFWIHGLRLRYEILHWSKAFGDRKVLV